MASPKMVMVDVDAGSDDAHALLMLLAADKREEIKLMGVTCVNGNTSLKNVCINVLRILRSVDRLDVPVFSGAADPLILPNPGAPADPFPSFHGSDGFGDADLPPPPDRSLVKSENAICALHRIVSENPGQVTLICVGPLTNIALAVKTYPDFVDKVKEIYIMGGNSSGVGNTTPSAEFNFFHDPEAAHIVLECVKKPVIILPWEACVNRGISLDWRFKVLGAIDSPQMELMNAVEKIIFKDYPEWLPCDALATAVALRPTCGKGKYCHMSVELGGWKTRGQSVIDSKHSKPNVYLLEDVDLEVFKELLFLSMEKY
ncbi:uncharacterized protein C1683.06c-like [Ischnura elegans]|uniref:uncharacterized protein C1683.06c-like n=1 Tax=Ischnura elegans TaxID=197161 RepID=UPI001ED8A564|nr:uncharacterized protein C1683.06c-like [Ischnura elegans]